MARAKAPAAASSVVPEEFAKYAAAAVWMPPEALTPWEGNPNLGDVAKVAASIGLFGFIAPICVWTSKGRIVAGHTRLAGYRRLLEENADFVPRGAPGPNLVPVRFHEFRSELEAEAYALADNRLSELAETDDVKLLAAIERIRAADPAAVLVAGYDDKELEAIRKRAREASGGPKGLTDPDDVPDVPAEPRTKPGDLWLLGTHRLVCGDSRDPAVVDRLVEGHAIDLLWTDPPYGVSYVGGTKAKLKIQNDDLNDKELRVFLLAAFTPANAVMKPGAAFYVAHPPAAAAAFFFCAIEIGWHIAQGPIWVKDRFVLGRSDYHARHESILYGWKEGAAHHAVTDRTQDTIWEYPRPAKSEQHPTMKPVELVERAVANSSNHGDRVLDLFGGSGTTLIACERRERVAYLVELSPGYCDVIVERWQRYTGKKATLATEPVEPQESGNRSKRLASSAEPKTRGKHRKINDKGRRHAGEAKAGPGAP